eukprot:7834338-Pyramimonas_sp.AAC.1
MLGGHKANIRGTQPTHGPGTGREPGEPARLSGHRARTLGTHHLGHGAGTGGHCTVRWAVLKKTHAAVFEKRICVAVAQ